MDEGSIGMFLTVLVCLILAAFFSMAETALMSVNKIHLRALADEGKKSAKVAQRLLSNTSKLLSTISIGNNIFNILATSLIAILTLRFLSDHSVGAATTIATGASTVLILIFGEITPKSYAARRAEHIALFVSRPLLMFYYIFTPINFIFDKIVGFFLFLLRANKGAGAPTYTEEDLKAMVSVGHEEGVLEIEERQMIENVFEFGDSQVSSIMTPRINVVLVSEDDDYKTVMKIFRENSYSRLPVRATDSDETIGVLNIRDIAFADNAAKDFSVKKYMRPAYFVYEFNNTAKVFTQMRKSINSLAIVLDEYGVMAGVVTMEDFVEEIVGDILDEYDENDEPQVSSNVFLVDGAMSLDDFNELCHTDIDSDDFDSIGGYVLGMTEKLPEVGETIENENIAYTIEKVENNRISSLKVELKEPGEEEAAAEG